ncbi:unnamed protein product [Notodromas monacha]|uniref:Palmitoyl-protein thioesterase ABHD10, mitochondrial n=1 Tax=Notodromas monacha TaxID=399045 RepID=A0A7R9G9P3_9CRUS|nr:unnamed protein product [Notodromas monacha]CAG0913118.1 unnamed protein product [Notodromas monacha]
MRRVYSYFVTMCQRKLHSYVRPSSRLVKVAEKRAVSYARILGCRDMPTIVYHPGFMNQKWGKKSTLLAQFCADKRLSYVTYECENVGDSPGLGFEKTPFHFWVEDARKVMEACTEGPLIIVASSMGTWLSTLGALDFFDRVKGIVLIGGAYNFLYRYYLQFESMATPEMREKLDRGEAVVVNHPWFGEIPFCLLLADSSRELEIHPGNKNMPKYSGPIRCIHGMKDIEMPFKQMMKDVQMVFPEAQIDFYLRKDGYHRMIETEDLRLLWNTLEELLAVLGYRAK